MALWILTAKSFIKTDHNGRKCQYPDIDDGTPTEKSRQLLDSHDMSLL